MIESISTREVIRPDIFLSRDIPDQKLCRVVLIDIENLQKRNDNTWETAEDGYHSGERIELLTSYNNSERTRKAHFDNGLSTRFVKYFFSEPFREERRVEMMGVEPGKKWGEVWQKPKRYSKVRIEKASHFLNYKLEF